MIQAEQYLYATMGALTKSGEFYPETLVWSPERGHFQRLTGGPLFNTNVIFDENNVRRWTLLLSMAAQPIGKLQYLQNSRALLDDVLRTHGNDETISRSRSFRPNGFTPTSSKRQRF